MENEKKNPVQNTTMTLKECAKDQRWLDALSIIRRDLKYRLKNNCYGEER